MSDVVICQLSVSSEDQDAGLFIPTTWHETASAPNVIQLQCAGLGVGHGVPEMGARGKTGNDDGSSFAVFKLDKYYYKIKLII